jgi:cellulose synthase/poly-beta-1,6-N-acetylglucosamine synthase-like glycosyltransferase
LDFLKSNKREVQLFEQEYSFLDYLVKQKVICKAKVAYLLLAHAYSSNSITTLVLNSRFLSYEDCITNLVAFTGTLPFKDCAFESILGDYCQVNFYCTKGYLNYLNTQGKVGILVKNLDIQLITDLVKNNPELSISICTSSDFFFILEQRFANLVLAQSKSFSKFVNSVAAADIAYWHILFGAFALNILALYFLSWLWHISNISILISQNCFKIFLIWSALVSYRKYTELDYCIDYPVYSILVPIYREENVNSILNAIARLLYPKHKLDVKLLVEDGDELTEKSIKSIRIPYYVHILRIPHSLPKTKPKALNFAMPYVTGQYLTIYDAEDIPEPGQLIKALEAFSRLPLHYICLQAKLRFYNMNENILTKMMSIEYSILFNYLIYGLTVNNFPVPLGGTSNHFKTLMLKQIGCWDAYNVAEDADLGMRIFANRYRVGTIDSFTSEEAPVDVWAWLLQRSRWIKGYWQTFFVFFCQRKRFTFKQAVGVYNFIGFATYSQFIFPVTTFYMIFNYNSHIASFWIINTIISFVYVIPASFLGIYKLKIANKKYKYVTLSVCYIFYFCLHFVASLMAILDLLITPFRWQKTEHGVSKTLKRLEDISLRKQ